MEINNESTGEMTKKIIKLTQDFFQESINEMTTDIMKCKSVSLFEARQYASRFLLAGITPKSKEFYEQVDKIKTLWES